MGFSDKLEKLMEEMDLSQSKLAELTGIGRPSISQYLSGKHEPAEARKRKIAIALGVQEDYFSRFKSMAEIRQDGVVNVPIMMIAKLMGKSKEWVAQGLQDGVFPWGYAVKMGKWSYFVSSVKFTEYTGIEVPINQLEEGRQ